MSNDIAGTYTIRHILEEAPCTQCGHPMEVGDKVYSLADLPFCSRGCRHTYTTQEGARKIDRWLGEQAYQT